MKKIILICFALTVSYVSGQQTNQDSEEVLVNELPSFSDATATSFVKRYEVYLNDFIKVAKSDDKTALGELANTRGRELFYEYVEIKKTLPEEDVKKLKRYINDRSDQMTKLMQ